MHYCAIINIFLMANLISNFVFQKPLPERNEAIYVLCVGGLKVPNTGEGFQNDENRVWGRFQNAWKNIHPCFKPKASLIYNSHQLFGCIKR